MGYWSANRDKAQALSKTIFNPTFWGGSYWAVACTNPCWKEGRSKVIWQDCLSLILKVFICTVVAPQTKSGISAAACLALQTNSAVLLWFWLWLLYLYKPHQFQRSDFRGLRCMHSWSSDPETWPDTKGLGLHSLWRTLGSLYSTMQKPRATSPFFIFC